MCPSMFSSGPLVILDTLQVVFEEVKLQSELHVTGWSVSEFAILSVVLVVARFGLMADEHVAARGNHQGAQAVHKELWSQRQTFTLLEKQQQKQREWTHCRLDSKL